MDFLCRIVEAAIKAGATTVNIPDTVGYTVPEEYFTHFMRMLIERVPNSDKAVFSVHCHNDLGMAVANSLAGVPAARGRSNAPSTASASGRQRRARRSRDGDQRAQRRVAVLEQDRHHHADAGLEAGVGGDLVPGAVQQGDRRPERVRA
jgi:hypothetical protein